MKRRFLVIGMAFSLVASAIAFASTGFTVTPGECAAVEQVEIPNFLPVHDMTVESDAMLRAESPVYAAELIAHRRRPINTSELIAQAKPLPGSAIFEVGWQSNYTF